MKANAYDIKFKRISTFILGDEPPRLYTRLVFYLSIPLVFWYFVFYGFLLVSMRMVEDLPNAIQVREGIAHLGGHYGISDMEGTFFRMGIAGMVSGLVFLSGLIVLWRRKKLAYFLLAFGMLACLLLPWLFFVSEYYEKEQSAWEWAYPSTLVLLLGIDYATRGGK